MTTDTAPFEDGHNTAATSPAEELGAMRKIVGALDSLDLAARARVWNWLTSRLDDEERAA